ncbi:receptor-type tyrosine-protein phosphatase kappa-like [Watersipora subatra]|uniref:receptor-type tyrosine-protein phosphatase kappa-like n=1 Tax=Watersipora subatra TaxID=2589382 RepID=UPI00355AE6E1
MVFVLEVEWSFSEELRVNDKLVTLTLPKVTYPDSLSGYESLLIAAQMSSIISSKLTSTDIETRDDSYITAHLPVSRLSDKFTVGDNNTYGGYVNRPLHMGDYTFYIGLKPVTEKVVDFTSSPNWQVEIVSTEPVIAPVTLRSSDSVLLEWTKPGQTKNNSYVIGYEISCFIRNSTYNPAANSSSSYVTENNLSANVTSLSPQVQYSCHVRAHLSNGYGQWSRYTVFWTKPAAIKWSFSEKEPVVIDTLVTLTLPTPLNLQSPEGYENLLIAVQTNSRVKRELSSADIETNEDYYITAELPISRLSDKFTVGDNKTYGGYVNRPLHMGDYTFYIGLKPVTEEVVDFASSPKWKVESVAKTTKKSRSEGLSGGIGGGLAVLIIIGITLTLVILRRHLRGFSENNSNKTLSAYTEQVGQVRYSYSLTMKWDTTSIAEEQAGESLVPSETNNTLHANLDAEASNATSILLYEVPIARHQGDVVDSEQALDDDPLPKDIPQMTQKDTKEAKRVNKKWLKNITATPSSDEYTKLSITEVDTHKYDICQPSGASKDSYLQDEVENRKQDNLMILQTDEQQAKDVRPNQFRDSSATASGPGYIKMSNIKGVNQEVAISQTSEVYEDIDLYDEVKTRDEDSSTVYQGLDAGECKQTSKQTCAILSTYLSEFTKNNRAAISEQFKNLKSLEKNAVTLLRLTDEPNSKKKDESYAHYADATMLKGMNKENTYIASRGKIETHEKTSSFSYCPETLGSSVNFQNFKVVLLAMEQKSRYVVRTLKIYKEQETFTVRQFEFPPRDELNSAVEMNSFVEFVRKVRCLYSGHGSPILVHSSCNNAISDIFSGGEEMSGVFIGLSILLEEAETTGTVNVMECVKGMRERRPQLIKTETEYSLVYEALNEAIQSEAYVCERKALKRKLETEKTSNLNEYKKIEMVTDQRRQHTKDSWTDSAAMLDGFYFLDSYRKRDQFIGGQAIEDYQSEAFWEMTISKNIQIIVILDSQQMSGFFPHSDETSVSFGKILVDRVNSRCNQMIEVINITVNSQPVLFMKIKVWADGEVKGLPDYSSLLYYLSAVERQVPHDTEGKICVMDSESGRKAVVFVAAYSAMEKGNTEQLVDVYGSVLAVRSRNRNSVFTVEDYLYLYNLVLFFLST